MNLSKRSFRRYSSTGLGVGGAVVETSQYSPRSEFYTPGEVTNLGIKAGKKIYGLMEFSVGENEILGGVGLFVSAGIGFNLSKWRD